MAEAAVSSEPLSTLREIEERMEEHRERSDQRRRVFRRMVDLADRYPGFSLLPARLKVPLVRLSFRLRPDEEAHDG